MNSSADRSPSELTPIQQRVLETWDSYYHKFGRAPAYREIAALVPGISSLSQIGPHLQRLSELGYLTHEGGIARATAPVRREIPVKGKIAAGEPLEMWEEGEWRMMDIALHGLPTTVRSALYALEVKGDSMIGNGILDGDWLIVREGNSAPDGTIVVAVDQSAGLHGAATVKRIFKGENGVRLQPANPLYSDLVIDANEWDRSWTIQGMVIATYRRY